MKLTRWLKTTIAALGIAMIIYQFLGVFYPMLDPLDYINFHLVFALLLVFLPSLLLDVQKGARVSTLISLLFALAAIVGTSYVFVFSEELQIRSGLPIVTDIIIGVLLVVVVLEANRRGVGLALSLFGLVFLAYAFFGQYLPHPLHHPAVSFPRMVSWMSISVTTGIYSNLLYISANVIFLYVMFAAVLQVTRAREFFMLVGTLVGNKIRGGVAQTAVVSSALVGSITGAATANVVITGSVTIPAMKKAGYKVEVAGAVEAIASSGGLLMPPVMGAVAFMMVSLTGLTYAQVCFAAIIPALLYFLSVGTAVFFHAGKEHIGYVREEVDTKLLLRLAPLFLVPFTILIALLALQFSAAYAAAWALLAGLVLGFLRRETRPSLRQLVTGLVEGAKTASMIAVMMALGGVFVSVMSVTGLGPKVVSLVEGFSYGYLLLVLFLTMFVSLLLGCAVPMSGGYLIVALLVGPILTRFGLEVIQAHFFALFFSVIGFLTPPVAPAALVASGLSGGSFMKTALWAIRLAAPCFLVPFMFCYDQALLGAFTGVLGGVASVVLAVVVVVSVGMLLSNYCLTEIGWREIVLGIASLGGSLMYFFTHGNVLALVTGLVCFVLLFLVQIMKIKRPRSRR